MAQITKTVLIDDIDNETTEDVRTYTFSVQGTDYEVELGKKNADKFLKALQPYQDAARKVSGGRGRPARASASKPNRDLNQARIWLRAQGYEVADKGRIRRDLLEKFDEAVGR